MTINCPATPDEVRAMLVSNTGWIQKQEQACASFVNSRHIDGVGDCPTPETPASISRFVSLDRRSELPSR